MSVVTHRWGRAALTRPGAAGSPPAGLPLAGLAPVGLLLAGLLLASAWSPTPGSTAVSRPMFTDVESAALAYDMVVLGTRSQPLQHLVDTGGATNGTGVPVLTYSFVLTRSSRGPAVTPASVTLVWTDTDTTNIGPDDAMPLVPGRPDVLFLEQVPEADRGGLAGWARSTSRSA